MNGVGFKTTSNDNHAPTPSGEPPVNGVSFKTSSNAGPTSTTSTDHPTPLPSEQPEMSDIDFKEGDWFLESYLPIIFAVLYRILWSYVYANIEPFFRMRSLHGGGALAENILLSGYFSTDATRILFKQCLLRIGSCCWHLSRT